MVMKKFALVIIMLVISFLVACGDSTAQSEEPTKGESADETVDDANGKEAKGVVAPEDFDKMYSDPSSYKGYEVQFSGQVFTEPEKDADGTYLQVYAKPENFEQNVLVGVQDPDLEVNTDDYVSITGIVKEQFEGENLMGGTIAAPIIQADTVEVVDYITAVSPTLKTIEVNQEIDQHGYVVNLQKVEIADNQTRVYVKAENNTTDSVSLFAHSTKLIVGNEQLESESNYESGLPELQSDILAGVESGGVITFPAIDENTTELTLHADGYSDNYELDIEPFVFEVGVE